MNDRDLPHGTVFKKGIWPSSELQERTSKQGRYYGSTLSGAAQGAITVIGTLLPVVKTTVQKPEGRQPVTTLSIEQAKKGKFGKCREQR